MLLFLPFPCVGYLAIFLLLMPESVVAGEWNRFRGFNGSGVSDTQSLPTHFGPESNLLWKRNLPRGKSSPVLTKDRLYITAYNNDGLLTLALNPENGHVLWRRTAPSRRLEKMHNLNDEASATPATDGKNVYVFFGGYGLLSYDPDGATRWRRPMGPFANFHGMAASPIIADGKVLMVCDQDRGAYIVAVNKNDGKVVWRIERQDMVHSFSTPLIHQQDKGPSTIVVPGSYQMIAYVVSTGEERWRVRGLSYQVKSTPTRIGDKLYFNGWAPGGMPGRHLQLPTFEVMLRLHDSDQDGLLSREEIPESWLPGNWAMQDLDKDNLFNERDWFFYKSRRISSNATLSIQLGGSGDITNTHILWRHQRSLPDVPSILAYDNVLYLIKNGGIVTTLDPETGKVFRQGRLADGIDDYYSSPVAGDGKVYMISRGGTVSVLQAGRDWEVLATNDLGQEVFSTPAVSQGRIYIRTTEAIYCFAQQ